MAELPNPIKAVVGLFAVAVDHLPEPEDLPEKALELPVLAVSAALQASLRAQQIYALLTARGDEALSQLRGAPSSPPPWATFDEDTDGAAAHGDAAADAEDLAEFEAHAAQDESADLTDDETQIPVDDRYGASTETDGSTGTTGFGRSAFDLTTE